MTQEMADAYFNEYMPYIFAFFVVLCLGLIINTHRVWNKIADPFRTRMKVNHDHDYDHKNVQIDGRNFKHLMVMPIEEGLFLAHCGLLPMIMMPKRVLIPWASFSKMFSEKRTVFGFVAEEYILNVSGRTAVQLKIPADIAKEILQKNYLKQEI